MTPMYNPDFVSQFPQPDWQRIKFDADFCYPISDAGIGNDLVHFLRGQPSNLAAAYELEEFWMYCLAIDEIILLMPRIISGSWSAIDSGKAHEVGEWMRLLKGTELPVRIDHERRRIIADSLLSDRQSHTLYIELNKLLNSLKNLDELEASFDWGEVQPEYHGSLQGALVRESPDFSFDSLCNGRDFTSMAFILGDWHGRCAETITAKRCHEIIAYQFEVDDTASNGRSLKSADTHLPKYLSLLTPVIITGKWSPVGWLATRLAPLRIGKERCSSPLTCYGLWSYPDIKSTVKNVETSDYELEFFTRLLRIASDRTVPLDRLLLIAACPWRLNREPIGALRPFENEDLIKSGRIIWQRTAFG